MAEEVSTGQKGPPESTGCLPVLMRLTWMAAGNAVLFLCGVFVAQGRAPLVADLSMLVAAAFLIAVRYADITLFNGETADGHPATLAHWRRYVVAVMFSATVLWATARIIALNGGI
jgi:hypothetical protein